jgi:ubiquinone/menaquinone biosynthesis C-methylase UbiE
MVFMKVPSFGPLEDAPCSLCGSSDSHLLATQSLFGEDFRIVRCNHCHLIRTNPRPTAEWKERFYDPKYNGVMETYGRDFFYLPTPEREPAYHLIMKFLSDRLPSEARLLDFGCAAGEFVKVAVEYGFDAWGCDYSEAAVAYGRKKYGLQLIQGQVESIPFDDNSFACISMLELFEHLSNPLEALKEIRRVLSPSGILFIETPNYLPYYYFERYLNFLIPLYCKVTGKIDLPWFPFDHKYHWTEGTITKMLSRAGFVNCQTHFIKNFRLEIPVDRPWSHSFRLYAGFSKWLFQFSKSKALDFRPAIIATAVKQD